MSLAQVIRLENHINQAHYEGRMSEVETGFTPLPNYLFDSLIAANLTKRQYKTVLAIARKTYGYHKSFDWVSNAQLAEMTGLTEKRCSETKRSLIEMGILLTRGRLIAINPDIKQWQFADSQTTLSPKMGEFEPTKLADQVNTTSPKLREVNSPILREQNPTKRGNTKETITTDHHNHDLIVDDLTREPQSEIKPLKTNMPKQTQHPKQPPRNTGSLNYAEIMRIFNQALPEIGIKALSDKRRRAIQHFWKVAVHIRNQLTGTQQPVFTLDDWQAYVQKIAQDCRWMLTSRPRAEGGVWRKRNFEYVLQEQAYLDVMEGTKDDLRTSATQLEHTTIAPASPTIPPCFKNASADYQYGEVCDDFI